MTEDDDITRTSYDAGWSDGFARSNLRSDDGAPCCDYGRIDRILRHGPIERDDHLCFAGYKKGRAIRFSEREQLGHSKGVCDGHAAW